MANNGILFGSDCLFSMDYAISVGKSTTVCSSDPSIQYLLYSKGAIACQGNSGWFYVSSLPLFNCEIGGPSDLSKIPTVADGVTLGWQAGGALILVGCLLFLKKVFK